MPLALKYPSPYTALAGFARGYIVTMRPYLLFVSGITGLAGMAFGGARFGLPELAAAIACFLSYGFGQALTDCFQTDTDRLSAPYRPLVRGEVRRCGLLAVSLAGLGGCGVVLIACHRLNIVLALADVAGLATYTWFKRRWWGGPWYNAWIVALLVAMGWCRRYGYRARCLRSHPRRDLRSPRTIYPQTGPNAGREVALRDWTFALEDGRTIIGSASTANGPKSKTFAWLTALLGGVPPVIGQSYRREDLEGRMALATIITDEGGWPKISNLSALPKRPAAGPRRTQPVAPVATTSDIPF